MEDLLIRGDMRVVLRPMRADDVARHDEFIAALEPEDLRYRFGARIKKVPYSERHRLTQVDHSKETTFVAALQSDSGDSEIVGEVRMREDVYGARAEFAIAVRSDLQRHGLGRALLDTVIAFARSRGVRLLYGLVDPSNTGMLGLARRLGFDIDHVPGGATAVVSLELGAERTSLA